MGIGTFVNRSAQPATASTRRIRTSTGDLILIAAAIALGIFGLLMLYSASPDFSMRNYELPTFIFNKQLLWLAIGVIAGIRALPHGLPPLAEICPPVDGHDNCTSHCRTPG